MPGASPHLPGCRALRGLPQWFLCMSTGDPSLPSHTAFKGAPGRRALSRVDCVLGQPFHWPKSLWRDSDPVWLETETGGTRLVWGPGRRAAAVWVDVGPLPWLMEVSSLQRLSEGALPPAARTHPWKHLKPLCFLTFTAQPLETLHPGVPPGAQSMGNGRGRREQGLWGGSSRGVIGDGCHCHLSSVGTRRGSQSDAESRGAGLSPRAPPAGIFRGKKLQAASPGPSPPCLEAPPTLRAALKGPTPWSPPTGPPTSAARKEGAGRAKCQPEITDRRPAPHPDASSLPPQLAGRQLFISREQAPRR